jgi:hypothetical protein
MVGNEFESVSGVSVQGRQAADISDKAHGSNARQPNDAFGAKITPAGAGLLRARMAHVTSTASEHAFPASIHIRLDADKVLPGAIQQNVQCADSWFRSEITSL